MARRHRPPFSPCKAPRRPGCLQTSRKVEQKANHLSFSEPPEPTDASRSTRLNSYNRTCGTVEATAHDNRRLKVCIETLDTLGEVSSLHMGEATQTEI